MDPIAVFAGSIPANYDRYLGPVLFEPYALDLSDRLKKDLLRNVLEIAAGTGRVTRHLLPLIAEGGKLTATDINPDMLDVARERIKSEKLTWQIADAMELPFSDNSFDHVVCQFGVMFFPDKLKAFQETWRVLQPGGKFIFSTWSDIEKNPRTAIIRKIMDELFKENAPDFLTKGPYSLFDTEEIRDWLAKAGFDPIKIEAVNKTSTLRNVDDFLKGFLEGSPLAAYLANMDEPIRNEINKRIIEEMKRQFKDNGNEVPMEALVCEGIKASR